METLPIRHIYIGKIICKWIDNQSCRHNETTYTVLAAYMHYVRNRYVHSYLFYVEVAKDKLKIHTAHAYVSCDNAFNITHSVWDFPYFSIIFFT